MGAYPRPGVCSALLHVNEVTCVGTGRGTRLGQMIRGIARQAVFKLLLPG